MVQLPPPVHGVATINQGLMVSARLQSRFDLKALPLRFVTSLDRLHTITLGKLAKTIAIAFRLLHHAILERPNLLYLSLTPTGGGFYRDCLFILIAKTLRLRRVYHLHGKGIAGQLHTPWRKRLYRWAFNGAWTIHLAESLSQDIADLVPTERVLVVPNGIPDEFRSSQRLPGHPVQILFLSNMIESKGPLILLEALAQLKSRGYTFRAVFAGARFNDGCSQRFDELRDNWQLQDCVSYVGPVYGAEKAALLSASDIFAYPTFNDAQPLVLLEALQYTLAIVSTHEGSIPSMVEDGQSGFLVPQKDVKALAERLTYLLDYPDERINMGQRGRQRFLEQFTFQVFEERLAEAFQRCLSEER